MNTNAIKHIAHRALLALGALAFAFGAAADERTGARAVVKLYRHNLSPKQGVLQSLLGLRHPDIVSIQDYGTWAGRFYEAMEYCEGGSMADAMPA